MLLRFRVCLCVASVSGFGFVCECFIVGWFGGTVKERCDTTATTHNADAVHRMVLLVSVRYCYV